MLFAAVNVTALVAALLYYGLGSSAAVRPARDRGRPACVGLTLRCRDHPTSRQTRAELRRAARVRARSARRARTARAASARTARLAAAGAAAGGRANRSANATPGGYVAYQGGKRIYYHWVSMRCPSHVDRCWHIKVITHDRCDLLVVEGYETYRRTIIGDLLASRENVRPKSPVLLELIGTSGATSTEASAPTIKCY